MSDQPDSDSLPPKLPKLTKFIKLIEPRARRASPQGHGKSLPDTVKTIDFASVLEGFWPNPSKTLRPRVRHPIQAKTQICDTVVRSELGRFKSAIPSITFFVCSKMRYCGPPFRSPFRYFPYLRYCRPGFTLGSLELLHRLPLPAAASAAPRLAGRATQVR